jgi:hypothetical protein
MKSDFSTICTFLAASTFCTYLAASAACMKSELSR